MQTVLQQELWWGSQRLEVVQLGSGPVPITAADEVTVRSGAAALDHRALRDSGRLEGNQLALEPGELAEVRAGGLTRRYRHVDRAPRAKGQDQADYRFFKIAAVCLLSAVAFIAMCEVSWRLEGSDGDVSFGDAAKYRKLLLKVDKPKPSIAKAIADAKARAPKSPMPDVKRDAAVAPQRKADKKLAVAGLFGEMFGGARESVFAGPGLGVGVNDALNKLGPGGGGAVSADGLGGMGARGNGGGGPGNLGIGGVGAFRGGRPPGGGELGLNPGKHLTVLPCGASCREVISDGLPKDVVAKVIARHLNEIKFCYEQELQQHPALAGKVAVFFTIDGTGSVSEAAIAETTLDSANAESCILARVRRWKFPEPRGGGIVTVTYPWIFKAAGGEE